MFFVGNNLYHVEMQKKEIEILLKKKLQKFFISLNFFGGWGVGNHLKHVEMQKKKFKYFFKMAAIAAILHFGPSPKSNGMILGPYLAPHQVSSKSVEEFFRNAVHKQTNKQTNRKG